ncbi:uncharacterized protein UDID_18454 [Ustilago sp. UG-2017a]|nr:uncharacterized protein UDID_18454 [Ustilago sp. UG-2017a]
MLPPTLNPGSSPASPVVPTPPHDAPSLPSLLGLPASPRKKLLYDTLKKPFDDQDPFAIIWIKMLELATLPNVRRKTRVKSLDLFLDNEYFDQLIDGLKSIADRLPEKFVDSFLHPSGSGAERSASLRERFDAETLLTRIEKSPFFQPTFDPVDRLAHVLQHAFIPGPSRMPSPPVRAPLYDFTSTFNGQALERLVDYIKVHDQLFPPSSSSPPPVHVARLENSPPLADHTHYQQHQSVPEQTRKQHRPVPEQTRKYYAKVLPIIQSSGFGKTRLCVQLSTVSPGMLVCLRESSLLTRNCAVSEPPQDKPVYDYFQRIKGLLPGSLETKDQLHPMPKGDQEHMRFNEAHLSILAWLAVYCQTTAYYLIQLQHASGCFDPPAHHQDPAACWRAVVFYYARTTGLKEGSLFETPSNLCHQSRLPHLCSTDIPPSTDNPLTHLHPANQAADPPPSLLATPRVREKILDYICETATTLASTMKGQYSCQLSDHELLTHAIRDHLKPRLQLVEHLLRDADPNSFFFLALDECSSMDTLLPYIRRVWFHAMPETAWILLIDTNSDLAPLAGKEARQGSRRMAEFDTHCLTQPFSAMPLDLNLTSQHRRTLFSSGGGQLTMRDLDGFLPRFGRPLWMDSRYHSDGFIMPTAIFRKLVLPGEWTWPDVLQDIQPDPLNETNQNLIALASRRLHLDLSSKAGPQHWYHFVSRQIAHHLRFVGRIYSTSDSIKSGTPSEPPVSLAVAWSVRSKPELVAVKWSMMVQAIIYASAPVGLNVGAQGELGVALLSTMAIDLAMSQRYSNYLRYYISAWPAPSADAKYAALYGLVSVHDWLCTLTGSKYVECAPAVSGSSSGYPGSEDGDQVMADQDQVDQGLPSQLASWARRAWLNFTHPAILPKQIPHDRRTGTELLRELWIRHATAQGVSNQAGWDLLIPVYESHSDQPPNGADKFDETKLSYIAIQVKNCINRPTREVKEAAVGPRLAVDQEKQCLELFFDLKGPESCRGHEYSQRRHPTPASNKQRAPKMKEQEEEDAKSRLLLRHHVFISGLTPDGLPLLKQLQGPAAKQVRLLFGDGDSLDTLEFDETHANYVRRLPSEEHRRTWDEAQTCMESRLVLLSSSLST